MDRSTLYALAGAALFVLGLYAVIVRANLLRKVIALNVMGVGVFMVLLAIARGEDGADPVPHAMVLTGIVVAVSVTAFAVALARRLADERGEARLPEDDRSP